MTYLWWNFYICGLRNFADILYFKNGLRYSDSDCTIGLAMPKNIDFDSWITSVALSNPELWENVIFLPFWILVAILDSRNANQAIYNEFLKVSMCRLICRKWSQISLEIALSLTVIKIEPFCNFCSQFLLSNSLLKTNRHDPPFFYHGYAAYVKAYLHK